MQKPIILTVFTPTYNRAHTLGRTYESLLSQDNKSFIWLIIDDGSTDGTGDMVKEWQSEDNGFEIRYIYKENGGMHTAHNTAYENIDSELNICIDSDDSLAPRAVQIILDKWNDIKNKGYAGIVGLDAYQMNHEIVGKGFPRNMYETTLSGYYSSGGKGDKKLIYRTEVINKYPAYPTISGEKYFSLSYKYRLIDEDYKLAVLDEVLCYVDYREDGSTRNMLYQYVNNPKGFTEWRRFCLEHPIEKKREWIDSIHYVSSSLLSHNKRFIQESPKKLKTVLSIPAGVLLSKYIRHKTR